MQVQFGGEDRELSAEPTEVGQELPEFTLHKADDSRVRSVDLFKDKTLISVVPNINTSVCSLQTKRFNSEMDKYPDVAFYTVSTNTVEEQKDWCAAEGVKNMEMLSDAEEQSFGRNVGVLMPALDFDARSIWITDGSGKVLYREILQNQHEEPNYQAALAFLKGMGK
ncbi:thiol peroxidase [Parascardovia denticolens]